MTATLVRPGASRFIWDAFTFVDPRDLAPADPAPAPAVPSPTLDARALYREDQERDDHGRFAPEGGSTTDSPSSRKTSTDALFQRNPRLAKYRGIPIVRADQAPVGSRHQEAEVKNGKIYLYDRFDALSPEAQDYVLAHEIGHAVLDEFGLAEMVREAETLGIDVWNNLPFAQDNMHEAFADAFASHHTTEGELATRYPQWLALVKKVARTAAQAHPRSLYDPDQPRDESGQWTTEGGGTESKLNPESRDPFGEPWQDAPPKELTADEIDARHTAHAIQRNRLRALAKVVTITSERPPATRTAQTVADLLEEMKGRGYEMPEHVTVDLLPAPGVHGAIKGRRVRGHDFDAEGALQPYDRVERTLEISIPDTLPDDADLDDAVRAVFSAKSAVIPKLAYNDHERTHYDRFTARSMRDVVIHEMGHVQAGHRGTDTFPMGPLLQSGAFGSTDAIRRAAIRVSEYASTKEDEFLAESFTRLYRGETLSEDSLKLYHQLRGPKIR